MKFTRAKLIQCDSQFKVWEYRGLRVVCDRKRVVHNDPGADTPCMVYYRNQKYEASSTYWCAMGTSQLEITKPFKYRYGSHELSQNQIDWLDSLEPEVTEFLFLYGSLVNG